MVLVDRVMTFIPGQQVIAEYDVPLDAFWTKGHFPQGAIFPGVLIAEAIAQTAALVELSSVREREKNELCYLVGLDRFRVRRVVRPGETLRLSATLTRKRLGFYVFEGSAVVGEDVVATGTWLAASGPAPEENA
jgi:3-hydroxyacyl-[acyl-carrier-protein] dehydratase